MPGNDFSYPAAVTKPLVRLAGGSAQARLIMSDDPLLPPQLF